MSECTAVRAQAPAVPFNKILVAAVAGSLADQTCSLVGSAAVPSGKARIVDLYHPCVAGIPAKQSAGTLPQSSASGAPAGTIDVHELGVTTAASVDKDKAEPLSFTAADHRRLAFSQHIRQAGVAANATIGEQIAKPFSDRATGRQRRGGVNEE